MDLRDSWEVAIGHLITARAALSQIRPGDDSLFSEFIANNELECALSLLEDVASEFEARTLWSALADAADQMGLSDRAAELRARSA